jgi:hypothetical protein
VVGATVTVVTVVTVLATVTTSAAPAAATDDGEDLSDLLVDEMPGYQLAPLGDPLEGGTGPIDWDEVGPSGPADGIWPEDMPSYVKSYFRVEGLTSVMLVAFDPKDLPESAMVTGFRVSLEQEGGEPLHLPDADAAGVDYQAFVVPSPDGSDLLTYSMAAFADDGIVVALYADTMRGDTEMQRQVLDDFVTAQVEFEPADRSPGSDRIGDDDGDGGDEPGGETAASRQPADGGGDGPSSTTRVALAAMWLAAMGSLGLLVWLLGQARRGRRAAGAGAAGAAGSAGTATWPATGRPVPYVPPADPRPAPPAAPAAPSPTHPPLPPTPSPPLGDGWQRPG